MTRFFIINIYFTLSLHFTPSLQSAVSSLRFTLTAQITDFSTENSSQRIKLFTGHVIKVNMFERKRKQANILTENTIM